MRDKEELKRRDYLTDGRDHGREEAWSEERGAQERGTHGNSRNSGELKNKWL
jgi:hypothetical protein